MRRLLSITSLALMVMACGSTKKTVEPSIPISEVNPTEYGTTITAEELKEALYTYASDEYEGREAGEAGEKKAIEFLKQHYVAMGIPSPISKDDYFQEVPLQRPGVSDATMTLNGESFENMNHMVFVFGSDLENLKVSEIVYAGYGIETDNYSDYMDLNVSGKVVLIKSGEPKNEDGTFVTTKTMEPTQWSQGRRSVSAKYKIAYEKGAKALLFLDDELLTYYSDRVKMAMESGHSGRLALKDSKSRTSLFMIDKKVAEFLYPEILKEDGAKTVNTDMTLMVNNNMEDVTAENVLAHIKGSEKPNEYIVISAHLDHEGVKDGEVYNGADDDGSGTVAILEIAEAFKTAVDKGHRPRRSILFLHVTAEEKGLLGSEYYTDIDPIIPLENTVADLNIDMIGRVDEKHKDNRNYVYLIGSDKLSTELHKVSEEVNVKYSNIELDYTYNDDNDPNRFYYRSDHYNFAKNNVPVIFYFNGTHADYHRPSDTPDKIQYDLLETRSRLIFYTAWELANREERIIVDKIEIKK